MSATITERLREIATRLRRPRDGRPWGADDAAADMLDAIAAELEAAPAGAHAEPAGEMPMCGAVPWDALIEAVCEAQTGNPKVGWERDPSYYVGHQSVSMNMNSLNRIVSKFATVRCGQAVEPAGDADMPVVAYWTQATFGYEKSVPLLQWSAPAQPFPGSIRPLVFGAVAQAAIASRDERINALEDAMQKSGESVVRFSDAWTEAQRRVIELEAVLRSVAPWMHSLLDRPPQTPEAKLILAKVDTAVSGTFK